MTISMPKEIRDHIRQIIWTKAEELEWEKLSDSDRANWYENWSLDNEIGGVLSHFIDPRKVRVYIKDSLLKPYLRSRLENNAEHALHAIGMTIDSVIIRNKYNKPHGFLFDDGKVICWGNSRDWKAILLSVFERAYRVEAGTPSAAILFETGTTENGGVRSIISDIARRLAVGEVKWIDHLDG